MKPKKKSRTLWSGGIISALGGFLVYMQGAPAGMFPPWVPYTAGGLVTLLGGVVLALKIQDRHLEARTKRTAADMLASHARETSAAKAAAKIGAGLMLVLAAGCDAQASNRWKMEGASECVEFKRDTERNGAKVQCTLLFCGPTHAPSVATLFCDEVPK